MMFPAAVDGHMPFLDAEKYRQQQIKKVIAKHKSRHRSGPDSYSLERSATQQKNAKSMPHLRDHVGSPRLSRPHFNSMPSLESQMNMINLADGGSEDSEESKKFSLINTIKHILTGTSKSKKCTSSRKSSSSNGKYNPQYQQKKGAKVRTKSSAPQDILCKSRADVSVDSNSPPGVSPKRKRTRTVSNISSVMETIEEIPENLVLEDDDSESDLSSNMSLSSGVSSASDSTAASGDSSDSCPDIMSTSAPIPVNHLMLHMGSQDSILSGLSDVICVA